MMIDPKSKYDTEYPWRPASHNSKLLIDAFWIHPPTRPIAVDCETDEQDNFVGLAVCAEADSVWYFTHLTDSLKQVLASSDIITHGGKFDIAMLQKWGVDVLIDQVKHDTQILAYSLDSSRKRMGLKYMAKEFLGWEWPSYSEMVGVGKQKKTLNYQPVEKVANYCGMDALATFTLHNVLEKKMSCKQRACYNETEMPIMRVLFEMEKKGIAIDLPFLEKLSIKFQDQIDYILHDLVKFAAINWNSWQQVLPVLKILGINVKSTNKKELLPYQDQRVVYSLLRYREISKLKSTYVDGILKRVKDGRIYTRFIQRPITGRLASAGPNLQNIPIKTENGKLIRKAFIASPDHSLVSFDYSQIELRLLAHLANDTRLIKAFIDGEDIHTSTASQMFDTPHDKVTEDQRRSAKTINFGIVYGQRAEGLAQSLGIDINKADDFINKYFNKFPCISSWISRTKWEARRDKGITVEDGIFIPLPRIDSTNKYERWANEREAVNYKIQGLGALIMKKAMIKLREKGIVANLQIHDDLLFDLPNNDESKELCKVIVSTMENVIKLSVPLVVNKKSGINWRDLL